MDDTWQDSQDTHGDEEKHKAGSIDS